MQSLGSSNRCGIGCARCITATEPSSSIWAGSDVSSCITPIGGTRWNWAGRGRSRASSSYLAVDRKVSAPTQNQALGPPSLCRHVLEIELPWLDSVVRAKPSRHLPVVLSVTEVKVVLANLRGDYWLVASLLYGAGLRYSRHCDCA